MRIVHFHPDPRMANFFVRPLLEAEINAGHDNAFVTSVHRAGYEQYTKFPYDLRISNTLHLPISLWRIRKYLKEFFTDTVVCHNTLAAFIPLLASFLAGVQSRIYFNHGVPYIGHHGVLRWLLYTIEIFNLSLSTHTVTVSYDMLAILKKINPQKKIRLIHHGSACGINLVDFSFDKDVRMNWRLKHELNTDDFVLLYVGRPERRKGFNLVLQLWIDYFQNTNLKLLLCGPETKDVIRFVDNVPSNILTLGFISNINEVMISSDLLILPSLHEGFSYACLEATASGLFIIANNIPGISELISNGKNGFLVNENDLSKYAEIINNLYKDKTQINKMRFFSNEFEKKYSREFFMLDYLSFLKEVDLSAKSSARE